MTQETTLTTDIRTPEIAAAMSRRDLAAIQADEMSAALSFEDLAEMVTTVRHLRKQHARELTAWLAANR